MSASEKASAMASNRDNRKGECESERGEEEKEGKITFTGQTGRE